jgi:hypothetical protein
MSKPPMIYDASIDALRPVTQEDVDMLIARAKEGLRFRNAIAQEVGKSLCCAGVAGRG